MGTHPIFESDFDCLTELKRVGRFCQIMDLDWFVDEVVSIATRLHGLDPVTDRALNAPFGDEDYENALVNQIQDIELEHQPESAANTVIKTQRRSQWCQDGPVQLATMNEPETDSTERAATAFDIPITPPSRQENSPLRRKKVQKNPRPHTIHVDGGGDVRLPAPRPRTNSDSNEQDENKPPTKSTAMAFEIAESTPKTQRDILARKRDRVIKKQQEREEELRRKKFDHEEQKRIQEREKMLKEETLSDLRKLENERRDVILRNHRASKATPTKPKKQSEKKSGMTVPIDPFSPSRVTRSQSSTLHRAEMKERDWDTMSCVSTLTTTRLYREPSTKSNRQLLQMALKYQCLPGPVNAAERKKAEEALNSSGAYHFMALYKQNKYKGLYEVEDCEDVQKIMKIHGIGPKEVDENMIEELLKYNSGVKSFQSVDSRTLSPAIDGFRLNNQCWLTRRPRTTPSQLK